MEKEEYRLMYELEETHWCFRGLHDLVFSTIQKIFGTGGKISILDAGCGTGFTLKCLNRYGTAFGVDISDIALGYCRQRGLDRILKASVSSLPFSDNSFDLVVSTEVLYHKWVRDDNRAIKEIYRVLKKGGILIVTSPAHDYLKRRHDEAVHTRHRYTKWELGGKLEASGFRITKITYRNAFTFPLLILLKLMVREKGNKTYADVKAVWGPLNSLFYKFLTIENFLLKKINMPFGTSVFCVSKKP